MSTSLPSTDPRLAQTAAAFAEWRSRLPRPSPIPAEFWSRAVELATTLGVSPVSRALKLDYKRLKQRMTAGVPAPVPAPPAFLELSLGVSMAPRGCTLALADGQGRSLRIAGRSGAPRASSARSPSACGGPRRVRGTALGLVAAHYGPKDLADGSSRGAQVEPPEDGVS
jgi:hypothetical protein